MTMFGVEIDYNKSPPDLSGRRISCHVSGGAGSAISAMRCVEWYGRERVTLVFADTNTESKDNYALVDAVERETGIEINRLNQNKDIWDVFDDEGVMVIRDSGACKASIMLKQKPLDEHTAQNFSVDDVVIAIGHQFAEQDRQNRIVGRLSPYTVFFPLNAKPRLGHCEIIEELERYNLPVSDAYKSGLDHDNCDGMCVLAGLKQKAAMAKLRPERFAYSAGREAKFYERTGFAASKDRRGGETKSYPLYQIAKDVIDGREFPDDWKSGCSCMLIGED